MERDSRSIEHNYRVGNWLDRESKNKYKTFHSVREDRLYLKENNYWRVYRSNNARATRIGNIRFTRDDDTVEVLPPHANRIVTYERINQQDVRLICH